MERTIPTVFLQGYELIDEETIDKIQDIETPLVLVENIENFKESAFWLKIRGLWVLVGKIPPLTVEKGDIVLFKEKGKWGLFRYLDKEDEMVLLEDAKGERKTKVPQEVLNQLELYGKVLRVQERV